MYDGTEPRVRWDKEEYFRGDIANKIEFYVAAEPDTFRGALLCRECFIISSAYEWLFRGASARGGTRHETGVKRISAIN